LRELLRPQACRLRQDRRSTGERIQSDQLRFVAVRRDARVSAEVRDVSDVRAGQGELRGSLSLLSQARGVFPMALALPGGGGSVQGQVWTAQSDPRPRMVSGRLAADLCEISRS